MNLNVVLKDEKGSNFPGDLTAREAIVRVLFQPVEGDERADGNAKWKLFKLASLVDVDGEIELSTADIETLKARVGKAYPAPLMVGRLWEILDPNA